tara:strand:- start:1685 stop:5815 length:4131 start_codon:yes stop_codon:yes gene_type:complete
MASKKKRLRKKNRRKVTKKHIKKNKIQYGGGVTVCEALLNRITKDINGTGEYDYLSPGHKKSGKPATVVDFKIDEKFKNALGNEQDKSGEGLYFLLDQAIKEVPNKAEADDQIKKKIQGLFVDLSNVHRLATQPNINEPSEIIDEFNDLKGSITTADKEAIKKRLDMILGNKGIFGGGVGDMPSNFGFQLIIHLMKYLVKKYKHYFKEKFKFNAMLGSLLGADKFIRPFMCLKAPNSMSLSKPKTFGDDTRTPVFDLKNNPNPTDDEYSDGLIFLIKFIRTMKNDIFCSAEPEAIKESSCHEGNTFKKIENATKFFSDFASLITLVNLEGRSDEDIHNSYILGQEIITKELQNFNTLSSHDHNVTIPPEDDTGTGKEEDTGITINMDPSKEEEEIMEKLTKNTKKDTKNVVLLEDVEDNVKGSSQKPTSKYIFVKDTRDVCENPKGSPRATNRPPFQMKGLADENVDICFFCGCKMKLDEDDRGVQCEHIISSSRMIYCYRPYKLEDVEKGRAGLTNNYTFAHAECNNMASDMDPITKFYAINNKLFKNNLKKPPVVLSTEIDIPPMISRVMCQRYEKMNELGIDEIQNLIYKIKRNLIWGLFYRHHKLTVRQQSSAEIVNSLGLKHTVQLEHKERDDASEKTYQIEYAHVNVDETLLELKGYTELMKYIQSFIDINKITTLSDLFQHDDYEELRSAIYEYGVKVGDEGAIAERKKLKDANFIKTFKLSELKQKIAEAEQKADAETRRRVAETRRRVLLEYIFTDDGLLKITDDGILKVKRNKMQQLKEKIDKSHIEQLLDPIKSNEQVIEYYKKKRKLQELKAKQEKDEDSEDEDSEDEKVLGEEKKAIDILQEQVNLIKKEIEENITLTDALIELDNILTPQSGGNTILSYQVIRLDNPFNEEEEEYIIYEKNIEDKFSMFDTNEMKKVKEILKSKLQEEYSEPIITEVPQLLEDATAAEARAAEFEAAAMAVEPTAAERAEVARAGDLDEAAATPLPDFQPAGIASGLVDNEDEEVIEGLPATEAAGWAEEASLDVDSQPPTQVVGEEVNEEEGAASQAAEFEAAAGEPAMAGEVGLGVEKRMGRPRGPGKLQAIVASRENTGDTVPGEVSKEQAESLEEDRYRSFYEAPPGEVRERVEEVVADAEAVVKPFEAKQAKPRHQSQSPDRSGSAERRGSRSRSRSRDRRASSQSGSPRSSSERDSPRGSYEPQEASSSQPVQAESSITGKLQQNIGKVVKAKRLADAIEDVGIDKGINSPRRTGPRATPQPRAPPPVPPPQTQTQRTPFAEGSSYEDSPIGARASLSFTPKSEAPGGVRRRTGPETELKIPGEARKPGSKIVGGRKTRKRRKRKVKKTRKKKEKKRTKKGNKNKK